MVTPTEKGISQALRQWAKLRGEKERIEAERDQAIAPHRTLFERRCAPIISDAQAKLGPVEHELHALEAEIAGAMMAGISESGGIQFTRVSTATAVAEVVTREEREIDPKRFFDSVPESQRSAAFWSCLKTLVGKADQFLGKHRVEQIAHAKRTHRVSIISQ